MCIIVAKYRDIQMPSKDILKTCFDNNSDGAGIMWSENGIVNIRKGFMKWTDFESFIDNLSERINLTETATVMHFRITTHGETNPQTCHPFPVSSKIPKLRKLSLQTDVGVAHNGIIPIKCYKGLSDTQTYIKNNLCGIKKAYPDFYSNKSIMHHIEKEISSKMCFLTAKGNIYTIGNFIEDNGILYSNSTYKERWYSYLNYFDDNSKFLCPIEGYVVQNGVFYECVDFDYFVDRYGKVYRYDYLSDIAEPLHNAEAHDYSDMPFKFNIDMAWYITVIDNEKEGWCF